MLDLLARPPLRSDVRIPYASGAQRFGDLWLPLGDGPFPLVVAIHGGFWRERYDLGHLSHLCAALAADGLAAFSLEYRRVGQAGGGFPGTLEDIQAGVAFADRLRHWFPIAALPPVLLGHSAGGQLALWAAKEAVCAGVVALAAVSDLRAGAALGLSEGAVAAFLGGAPAEVPERYRFASPAERLPLRRRQVLLHGALDADVPLALSERYQAAAKAAGDEALLETLPQSGHFELIDPGSAAFLAVLRSVRSCLP